MHKHDHVESNQKNILVAFGLNAGFAIIEFIGGYLTNSVAVYSDALHDLGDSIALLCSYIAERISLKKADRDYTFGYKRVSVLAALINAIILIIGSGFIIREAIIRFQHPEIIHPEGVILIALLGLLVNCFAAYKMSKNSGLNSRMIMFHLLEDILGWVAVLIVSIILLFKPWYFLDSILSILIALIIISGVVKSLSGMVKIFLQAFPEGIDRGKIIKEISGFDNVIDVHFVQGWSVDESSFNLTLHVKVSSSLQMKDVDILRHKIQHYLNQKKVLFSTIQFEGNDCDDKCEP